jgi:hypothetical protein
MEEVELSTPIPPRVPRWGHGALVGLGAAALGVVTVLLAGAIGGQGIHILSDAGQALLPGAARAVTGVPAALAYPLSHTVLYVVGASVVLALTRLALRFPGMIPGLVLGAILLELAFLFLTMEGQMLGHFDDATRRAMVAAHVVSDVALVFGMLWVQPGLRQALVRSYEE